MRDVERFARDAVSPDVQPVREAIFGVIVLRGRACVGGMEYQCEGRGGAPLQHRLDFLANPLAQPHHRERVPAAAAWRGDAAAVELMRGLVR